MSITNPTTTFPVSDYCAVYTGNPADGYDAHLDVMSSVKVHASTLKAARTDLLKAVRQALKDGVKPSAPKKEKKSEDDVNIPGAQEER